MDSIRKRIGGNIFKSIMSSYLVICGLVLIGTMAGYIYSYRVLDKNVASLSKQRATIAAANFDKEFGQLFVSLDSIAVDRNLLKTLNLSEKEMGAQVTVLNDLREMIKDNIHRTTIKEAYVYYFDTNCIFSMASRFWNSEVIDAYIKNLGLERSEFDEIVDFTGIDGGTIFADGRIWLMNNVYDDHYKKKAVIVFECLMNEVDVGEPSKSITALSNRQGRAYVSDISKKDLAKYFGTERGTEESIDGYYFVKAALTTLPWDCYVGVPKTSHYKSVIIFWAIFAVELIGAIVLTLILSFRSTSKMWKPIQELMDVINATEDVGFMETIKGVNDKVSYIMTENSLMQQNVSKLEPYMYENRIGRILDGDITSKESVVSTFTDFTGISEGEEWSMILVRPQNVRQGSFINGEDAVRHDSGDKDIMSFTLKNVIDELTGNNYSRVYKYGDDYLLLSRLETNNENSEKSGGFEDELGKMSDFFEQTMGEPIFILMGDPYTTFENVRDVYLSMKAELEYRIFWRERGSTENVWSMRSDQDSEDMVDFGEYSGTARAMLNCLDTGNFKEASELMDSYLNRSFPHDRESLRQNNYRMYGLIAILTMSISYRMEKADEEFMESLNYEQRLMNVSSMEELREVSKSIFASIIEYTENKEKDGIPAWMDDVEVYIKEHYTEQGFSVSRIADEYGFTVSHLSRTFKSVVGTGLLEYIQKLRVEKAKELLMGGASVNDAAIGAGYLDAKALTRAFKKYEGITPGSYRDSKK